MRPFVVVTGDFVKTGGMDRANYALASYLARQPREVHLVAFRVADDLLNAPNVRIHPVPKLLRSYLLSLPLLDFRGRKVARRLAETGAHVLVNGGNCRFGDANWVHHVHATDPLQSGNGIVSGVKSRVAKFLARREERLRIPLARTIITTCQRTKRDIVTALNVPAERIQVVYLGVDAEKFRPRPPVERAQIRARLGWPENVPHVAFIGAMGDRRKGFDVLYAAWQRLCTDPAWTARLVVVGRGRDADYWKDRSRTDGLDQRIEFIRFVPDLADMVAACDAHVLPSRYEGYSMVTHEALCCGVPALVTCTAGIAERYPESLRELLIDDPNDDHEVERRLRAWYANREDYRARTEAFSAELRAHTWDDMAAQMVRIIEGDTSGDTGRKTPEARRAHAVSTA